jgi:hypothetical protein
MQFEEDFTVALLGDVSLGQQLSMQNLTLFELNLQMLMKLSPVTV